MRGLTNRIAALERDHPTGLSPADRLWLGWPLSAAEQQALDAGGDESEMADIDKSEWSQEAKAWLGVG